MPPGRGQLEREQHRLLPDRAVAHRPDREEPVPRAVPQRHDVEPPRHRPGLPRDIRDRLFREVYEHWGSDHAGAGRHLPPLPHPQPCATWAMLGLPAAEIDRLAKLAEGYGSASNVRVEMERVPELRPLAATRAGSHLIEPGQLANFPRHLPSTSVGGHRLIRSSTACPSSPPPGPVATSATGTRTTSTTPGW